MIAGALMLAADDAARRTVQQGVPAAWRNVVSQPQRTTFEGHEPVEWWGTRDGFVVDGVTVLEVSPSHARLEVDGVTTRCDGLIVADRRGGTREVYVDGPASVRRSARGPPLHRPRRRGGERFAARADARHGRHASPSRPGPTVAAGDAVLVLEAMKMQHTVTAPHAGTVAEINVEPGAQVASGEVLAVVEENTA